MKTLLIILLIALAGCKSRQLIQPVPVQYREVVKERIVAADLPSDSASIIALFECDSLNRVIMRELSEEKSKRIQSQYSFRDGVLMYRIQAIPGKAFVTVTDTFRTREIPIAVKVPVEVNRLTKWQSWQIMSFRILATIALLYALFKTSFVGKLLGKLKFWK
ncbi:MAG: hypothetical protein AB2L20_14945 [Mangrovibacterium sp.]